MAHQTIRTWKVVMYDPLVDARPFKSVWELWVNWVKQPHSDHQCRVCGGRILRSEKHLCYGLWVNDDPASIETHRACPNQQCQERLEHVMAKLREQIDETLESELVPGTIKVVKSTEYAALLDKWYREAGLIS